MVISGLNICKWTRMLAGAVVLVIAFGVADTARAACGYYVVAQHPSESMAAGNQQMRSHAALPAGQHDCPCNGPMCRAHQSGSPVAPPVQTSGADQQFACLDAATDLVERPFTSIAPLSQTTGTSVYPSTTDPPPRSR